MIFCKLQHEDRPDLRAFIVADDDSPPTIMHFYLEKLVDKNWIRSRKIKADLFEKYMDRLKFDKIEARFLLEEAAEKEEY